MDKMNQISDIENRRNPYTILFGRPPLTFLPRDHQRAVVLEEFTDKVINTQAYVIVGLRGSGKTVFMTDIAKHIDTLDDWVVIDLNSERNLLEDMVSSLNSRRKLHEIFRMANINLSYFGLGLEISGASPVTNVEEAARLMLKSLKKHNKRVLVTVDEISNSKSVREFALAFQSFIRSELPIFFLSTGLYENIHELEASKGSTFFMRTPKIEMGPLSLRDICDNYQETFSLERTSAIEMANMTRGYSFAFQVLGHYTWQASGDYLSVIGKYRNHLFNYSYDKIWSELSHEDKELAYGIAKSAHGKVAEIREILGWNANKIGPYRKRLQRKGLVNLEQYGYIFFSLPLFSDFVIEKREELYL